MTKKYLLLFIFQLSYVSAQVYFPDNSGVKSTSSVYQAFTNATIHISPGNIITNATLLEKNGVIVKVGENISLPKKHSSF